MSAQQWELKSRPAKWRVLQWNGLTVRTAIHDKPSSLILISKTELTATLRSLKCDDNVPWASSKEQTHFSNEEVDDKPM
jgi:hypothetical protein